MKTLCLIVISSLLISGHVMNAADLSTTNHTIIVITGTVEVAEAGSDQWKEAQLNQSLKAGDKVRTAQNGKAAIRLVPSTVVRIPASTTFEVPKTNKP